VDQVSASVRHWPIPPMSEKHFQQRVVDYARLRHWRVQTQWLAVHSPSGWPDVFMVRGGVAIAAELKIDGQEPRANQQAWLDELDAVPGIVAVCWHPSDWDQIKRALA